MAAILKNVKCDISATVWPILIKFGIFALPSWWTTKSLRISKSNMADENREKSRYLHNCLAHFDKILRDDTVIQSLTAVQKIKLLKI